MGLTDEQFTQIRRALRLPVGAMIDPSGKRASARWAVDGIVAFAGCRDTAGAPAGEPPAKWVNLIDLSPTGASILSKSQIAPGEHFVLALPGDGEVHYPAVCAVQYSRVKLDGTFRVGAEFREPVSAGPEKVQAALAALKGMGLYVTDPTRAATAATAPRAASPEAPAQPEGPGPKRQRRSERRMADGRAVIHTYDEEGEPGPIEEVPALDFSATGVCIFRREPLKVGEQFMARIPLLEAPPIISLCRVTNCVPCEGENRYRIGAEFTRAPGIAGRILRWFKRAG